MFNFILTFLSNEIFVHLLITILSEDIQILCMRFYTLQLHGCFDNYK